MAFSRNALSLHHSNIALALLAALSLAACEVREADDQSADTPGQVEPVGGYAIDPETGEISATHTGEGGAVTRMRAGADVPVQLPDGFTLYPGAEVIDNTRVEQADSELVVLRFVSAATQSQLIDFYREQAGAAGVTLDIDVGRGDARTVAGRGADGRTVSLVVTRGSELTRAQLSLARGVD